MPSNDDVLWGLPCIQCPCCQSQLDTSGTKIEKYSKQQREAHFAEHQETQWGASTNSRKRTQFDGEDSPSDAPENTFMVLSCPNRRCPQYNKIKILRIPRLHAPSVKVDL